MIEKYIIEDRDNQQIAGLGFNMDTGAVSVGGFSKYRNFFETIIAEYLKMEVPEFKKTQVNKIKYFPGTLKPKQMNEILVRLSGHGLNVEKVKTIGRIWC